MAFKFKSVKNQFAKVKEQMETEKTKGGGGGPEWMFKPQLVKGEDETVFRIRFLPVPESTTGKPWVEVRYHMFEREGDNQYVKAIDPRSFDKNAANPISDLVKKLYASGNSMDADQAANIRSKARYMTLVYIIEAPENQKQLEGKVLVYEAGIQVFKKLDAAINKLDLCFWDPFEGTDFLLTITETGNAKRKWPNYEGSEFVRKDSPITKDDDEMEKIAEQIDKIKIKELLIDRDGLKTGEELREMMEGGMTGGSKRGRNDESAEDLTTGDSVDLSDDNETPDFGDIEEDDKPKKRVESKKEDKPKKTESKDDDEGEVTADLDDLDIDFSETDFNLDD